MKSAVTVSLVPETRGGPFVFQDEPPGHLRGACAVAKSLGFDAIEIFPAEGYGGGNADVIREVLDDHGLAFAAAGTGAGWVRHKLTLTSSDPAVRRRAKDFVRSVIDFAGSFGAPVIIGSMQGRWGDGVSKDTALGWLGEALAELGEHALPQPLLFEPLNRYESNLTNTLADGVALKTAAGATNVKLLADLFHMNIEEADLPAAVRDAGVHIGHVHLADSNRRAAGLGHTDFRPIFAALRDVKYTGYLSAEVFPLPDPDTAAAITIRTVRDLTASI